MCMVLVVLLLQLCLMCRMVLQVELVVVLGSFSVICVSVGSVMVRVVFSMVLKNNLDVMIGLLFERIVVVDSFVWKWLVQVMVGGLCVIGMGCGNSCVFVCCEGVRFSVICDRCGSGIVVSVLFSSGWLCGVQVYVVWWLVGWCFFSLEIGVSVLLVVIVIFIGMLLLYSMIIMWFCVLVVSIVLGWISENIIKGKSSNVVRRCVVMFFLLLFWVDCCYVVM